MPLVQVGCSYVAAYLSTCLLLPLVLAGCAVLAATWLWAAVSCVSIAGTPCLSRLGFALWIALQLWNLSRGELLRGERSVDECCHSVFAYMCMYLFICSSCLLLQTQCLVNTRAACLCLSRTQPRTANSLFIVAYTP